MAKHRRRRVIVVLVAPTAVNVQIDRTKIKKVTLRPTVRVQCNKAKRLRPKMLAIPSAGSAIVLLALRDGETGIDEHHVEWIGRSFIEYFQRVPSVCGGRRVGNHGVIPNDAL